MMAGQRENLKLCKIQEILSNKRSFTRQVMTGIGIPLNPTQPFLSGPFAVGVVGQRSLNIRLVIVSEKTLCEDQGRRLGSDHRNNISAFGQILPSYVNAPLCYCFSGDIIYSFDLFCD